VLSRCCALFVICYSFFPCVGFVCVDCGWVEMCLWNSFFPGVERVAMAEHIFYQISSWCFGTMLRSRRGVHSV
jgi:hypothetical protein